MIKLRKLKEYHRYLFRARIRSIGDELCSLCVYQTCRLFDLMHSPVDSVVTRSDIKVECTGKDTPESWRSVRYDVLMRHHRSMPSLRVRPGAGPLPLNAVTSFAMIACSILMYGGLHVGIP